MFSPSAWLSENGSMVNDDSDASFLSEHKSIPASIHQTPKNPIDEFRRMQHQSIKDSPNARLAEFFAKKGTEPLSEIELEGVKALLNKSNSVQTSPRTPSSEKADEEDQTEILKLKNGEPAVKNTPSFKATYNSTVSAESSFDNSVVSSHIGSSRKRRVFDFSGFPSPYRTSRLKESSFSLEESSDKPDASSEAKVEPLNTEKKLSNTASALLSFIENHEATDESSTKKEQLQSKTKVDYTNPYATISTSHRKAKKAANRKPTAFEQLEKSLASAPKTELTNINKYKPTKASSLRESISLNDTTDRSFDEIEVEKPEQESETPESDVSKHQEPSLPHKEPELPKPSEPTISSEEKPSESKPLFSFAPKPTTASFTLDTSTQKDGDNQQLQRQDNTQLKGQQFTFTGSVINQDTRPPSTEFTFRFPNAESLGYKATDINEQKVTHFKTYFTF